MAIPFSLFIFKVVSPCNLNCTYCYEYNLGDDSWKSQPKVMSLAVAEQATKRIRAHLEYHNSRFITIVLHGGEPLLAGIDHLQQLVDIIRQTLGPDIHVDFGTQTNGILLTTEFLAFFEKERFQIGISCDGPPKANDLNRVYHSGRGSGNDVQRALELLKGHHCAGGGILCVIDLRNDPLEVWEYLASFNPPGLDFLLPHGHWDIRPTGKNDAQPTPHLEQKSPYAEWLIPIFDRWFSGDRRHIRIRYFEEILEHLMGGPGCLESLGLGPATLVIIAPDGSYEGVDTLKVVMPGEHILGLNVFEHSAEEVLVHPKVKFRQSGISVLCEDCKVCRFVEICGAGYLPHRFSKERGFQNPSVYCADLYKLIGHIRTKLLEEVMTHAN